MTIFGGKSNSDCTLAVTDVRFVDQIVQNNIPKENRTNTHKIMLEQLATPIQPKYYYTIHVAYMFVHNISMHLDIVTTPRAR